MSRTRPLVRNQKQSAKEPHFAGSDDDFFSNFSLPIIIGGIGGVLGLGTLLACIVTKSRNRNRVNHDPSDWIYNPPRDTFALTALRHHRREPIIVHDDWNHSDHTITPRHNNVVVEHVESIRRPENAVIRDEQNTHTEDIV